MKRLVRFLMSGICVTLTCAGAELPPCPLTDAQAEDLLRSLSPEIPALAPVFSALEKKDLPAAKHLAAEYFRKREAALPRIPDPYQPERADRTVQGVMDEVAIRHTFPNGVVDWTFNPTKAPGRAYDPEWQWQLGRMRFWRYLAAAYRETHDEKYARTFVQHLRTWAATFPRPKDSASGNGSGWRTIECGIRLLSAWPRAFREMANAASVTDDDVLLYLYCSREQVRHVMQYHRTGNWLTMEMNGAYTFASDNPEFSGSKAVRQTAVKLLSDDIQKQFLPDGAQYELSPGYHTVALENSLSIIKLADQHGFRDEIPPGYREILTRGAEYVVKLLTPDRTLPKFNDSWDMPTIPKDLRDYAAVVPSPLLNWAAKGAKPGEDAPKFTSLFLPYAGLMVFRSGWGRDAHALYFDAGPLGKAHCHEDKLQLILYGYGEELLYDDGGGNYETSAFRSYALSSKGHSLIVIDGQGQDRRHNHGESVVSKPIDAHFVQRADSESAWADYLHVNGKFRLTHRRQVLWIKPDLFLVCDRLLPKDGRKHHYEARWQVDSRKMQEILPGSGILTSLRGKKAKADLVVAPLMEGTSSTWVSGKAAKPMGGLYVGRKPRPFRPAVTVSHERSGKGTQTFLTLLQPVKAGSAAIRSVEHPAPGSVRIAFCDGRVLSVTVPDDPQKLPAWNLKKDGRK